jgi:anti-sigma factor RsiW
MTRDKDDMNERLPEWESQVNALLDGELDEVSTEALKRAAAEDRELARAIIEAYELQRDMDQIGLEVAPASLRKKLRRIPREQRISWRPQRWALATAMAAVPLLAISITLMQPSQPSAAEVEQARQDLAVAFAYIDKVGSRTGGVLQSILSTELQHGVTDNISKHIPYTEPSTEEKSS